MIRYCTELQSVQYLNPHVVSIQEEEHMKKESMEVLRRIVKREQEFFGIRVIKKENTSKVRQMYPEAWHMFYLLENENNLVPPLEIQGTMEVLKNDQIRSAVVYPPRNDRLNAIWRIAFCLPMR